MHDDGTAAPTATELSSRPPHASLPAAVIEPFTDVEDF